MIPCGLGLEPQEFDARTRQLGRQWLDAHPSGRPRDFWSDWLPALSEAFDHLCAYSAMFEPVGTVDHFKSINNREHPENRPLAYEWSNFRFASHWVNSKKGNADDSVLDPLLVQAGWFEVSLPDLQLRVTDACPPQHRAKADFTLDRLGLRHHETILRQRRHWLAQYEETRDLRILQHHAPLLAAAVERQLRETR
jgi:hypothetical protein